MKAFFDTSVLMAAFWANHPEHRRSFDAFHAARKKEAACAAHSLAEIYAVMTRLPVRPVLAPEQILLFLQEICGRLTIIVLGEEDYSSTLQDAAQAGLTGGRIYDALLLQCAIKAKADTLYTWNLKHFEHSLPPFSGKIKTP